MESKDESVKRVKFTQDTNDTSKFFTPLARQQANQAKNKNQDRNKLIVGTWVRLSQEGYYEQLKEVILQFGLQGKAMVDFFTQEGSFLLRCGICHWNDPKALRFICENVPKDLLTNVLRKENYEELDSFLIGESGLEKRGKISEASLKERKEKLILLLKTDPEGVKTHMESENFKAKFSPGVQQSCQDAVEEHKKNHAVNKL